MEHAFRDLGVWHKKRVNAFVKPQDKLKRAMKVRKQDRKNFPGLNWGWLGEQVGIALQKEVGESTARTGWSRGVGLDGRTITAIEDVLLLGHGFLSNGKDEDPPTLTHAHASTTMSGNNRVRGFLATVKVYRGGSSKVWVMDEENTEDRVVYRFPGEESTYVKVADASLKTGGVGPSQVVRFSPQRDPLMGRMLLVQSISDPKAFSIRRFDDSGEYVDPTGKEEPLPLSGWQTVGVATDIHAPDGIHW